MKDTGEYKAIFSDLFEKIEKSRKEQPSAGTKFRLMGLAADIMEMVDTMQHEVLDVVSREAVLEADADIDYTEHSKAAALTKGGCFFWGGKLLVVLIFFRTFAENSEDMKHNYFSVMPRAARLLLVVVLALVMPAQTWARDVRMFMTDLLLVGAYSNGVVNELLNAYKEKGYVVINYDLNKGCGQSSDYVYLLYKPADWNDGQNHGYITDLAIKTSTDYPDSFYDYETEMTYYLVPYAGDSRFTGTKGDLNSNAGGAYLHLYYSTDENPHAIRRHQAITQIYFDSSSTDALSSDGAAVDLNKGAGGAYIYLHYNKDLYTHIRPGVGYDLATYSSPDHTLYLANLDRAYGTLANPTDIVIREGANVAFIEACINEGSVNSGRNVICAGDATIEIDGFCSIHGGGPNDPAIRLLPDHKLTLTGKGTLYAYCGTDEFGVGRAAGIGAGYMSNCGDIEILRGDV